MKSGQSTSVKYSSAYADCQGRKLDRRSSPLGRMIRSGSGMCAVYRCAATVSSVMSAGSSVPSLTSCAIARTAFSPLGVVQLFDESQRSAGIRYLKKLAVEALTFAVIVGILYAASLMQVNMMEYAMGDVIDGVVSVAAIPDIFKIENLAAILIIQLAAVGGMFKNALV